MKDLDSGSDNEDEDMSMSDTSDMPKKEFAKQKHPENEDQRNKLKLAQFHRYTNEKPKKRAVPAKKKLRDLERFL